MNLLLLTITLIKIIEINCHGRLVDPAYNIILNNFLLLFIIHIIFIK
jgi:hypothetical protein